MQRWHWRVAAVVAISITVAVSASSAYGSPELLAAGKATFYEDGIMEIVLKNRNLTCPECIGHVALLDCTHLATLVSLRYGGKVYEPLLVADCAARQHAPGLVRSGWAVDVEWQLAEQLGMTSPRRPLAYVEVYAYTEVKHGHEWPRKQLWRPRQPLPF